MSGVMLTASVDVASVEAAHMVQRSTEWYTFKLEHGVNDDEVAGLISVCLRNM